MSLNTAIRGVQIRDNEVDTLQLADDGVTNAKLANMTQGTVKVGGGSDAPTDLDAKTNAYMLIGDGTDINSVAISGDVTVDNTGAVAIGATKVTDAMLNDDVATGLAGDGLSASAGVMALDLNELTGAVIDVSADSFAIVDASDTNASRKESIVDFITAIAGSGLTATSGVLSVDATTDNIVESDIKFENFSSEVDASGYSGEHTLAVTPIVNSVQIYLNGLIQEEGSGKDYTLTGSVIQFATDPISGDIVLAHYIQDN